MMFRVVVFGGFFLQGLLFLVVATLSNGQQVGVSLKLHGVAVPNNSLVDFEDILYTTGCDPDPVNAHGYHDVALRCVTDLEDCCDAPRTVRGRWYYPDGREAQNSGTPAYRSNRGPNEVINGEQFYGSVRLWRRYSPTERGRFRCELPDAAGVVQTLYVSIVNFRRSTTISASGSSTAGETHSLTCSVTLFDSLPSNVPTPYFEWFFGPSGNASILSGVTPSATTVSGSDASTATYTSILQFSPLSQSHEGMYTCRLGPGTLARSAMINVNVPAFSILISTNGAPVLGQNSSNLLRCSVSGADNLNGSMTYLWTKNNGTQTHCLQIGADPVLSPFTPLRLSDVGRFTCQATLRSPFLDHDIIMMESHDITLPIPAPASVVVTSSAITAGDPATLNCTVELVPSVTNSDLSSLVVDVQLSRLDGSLLSLSGPILSGTTLTYTTRVNSFGRNDSGVYTCGASIRPKPSLSEFLTASSQLSGSARVTAGVYLVLKNVFYSNNSYILNSDIGEGDDGALLCFTDLSPCCDSASGSAVGEWFFPDESHVPAAGTGTDFYRDRGPGTVRLHRRNNATSQTGRFCCEIPNASFVNTRICANIVLELPTTTSPVIEVRINFQGVYQDSPNVSFSLTCNSSGGPATRVMWTRDGLLLDNTSPLVPINASSSSYTNVLVVNSRKPGTYTCQIGGPNEQMLTSTNFSVQDVPPPVNVQATQSASSAPVEVSWSPPSDGAIGITGYRIFHASGQNFLVPSYVTSANFNLSKSPSEVGQSVSVRSESKQLPSELISVRVQTTAASQTICYSQIGIATGALIIAEGLCATVIAIVVALCWLCSKHNRRKSGKRELTVSTNISYNDMLFKTEGEELYANDDKLYEQLPINNGEIPSPKESPATKPEPPVRAIAEKTTGGRRQLT